MNTRLQEGLIPGIFRRSFAVLAMAALVLGAPVVGGAQAPSGGEKTPPKACAPAAQNVVPVARVSSPAPAAGKGLSTGIQVHGHWVIQVKNPDGTVTARREFENALLTGANQGSQLLANLLGAVDVPGAWEIDLSDGTNTFAIEQQNTIGSTICADAAALHPSTVSCSNTLSVTTPANPQGIPILTLIGSAGVPQSVPSPDSIVSVGTNNYACAYSTTSGYEFASSPTACLTGTLALQVLASGGLPPSPQFTSASPPPVPISAGQTVQVTVTFSFSSN
jgi:hypothetical protein